MVLPPRIIGFGIEIFLHIVNMVWCGSSQYLAISGYMSLDSTNFTIWGYNKYKAMFSISW